MLHTLTDIIWATVSNRYIRRLDNKHIGDLKSKIIIYWSYCL